MELQNVDYILKSMPIIYILKFLEDLYIWLKYFNHIQINDGVTTTRCAGTWYVDTSYLEFQFLMLQPL